MHLRTRTEDLKAVTNADNIKIVMKDGVFYKNTL